MINKIIVVLFCLAMLFSCGKKADPEYKESKTTTLKSIKS